MRQNRIRFVTILLVTLIVLGAALAARQSAIFPALKSSTPLGKQAGGFYLLPTSQLLRPWGEQAVIPGRPVDMTYDSRKRLLAVLDWRSILLLDGSNGSKVAEVKSRSTSYTGIAFRPGDRELWASETSRNGPDSLLVVELSEIGAPGASSRIDLPGHPVPAGIAFSADGKTAYVALSRNNTLAVVDAAARQVRREIEVGMAPFGVAVGSSRVDLQACKLEYSIVSPK